MWWLGLPDLPWVNLVSASFGSYTCIFVHTCTIVPAEHYSTMPTLSVPCIFTLCHLYSAHHCIKSTGWALQYTAYTVLCIPYINRGSEQSVSVILRVDWVDKSDSLVHLCGSCIHWELLSVAVVGEKSFLYRLSSRVVAQWRLLMMQPAEVLFSHPPTVYFISAAYATLMLPLFISENIPPV